MLARSARLSSSAARVAQGGGSNVSLTGAGATFPAPLYQRWFSEYNKQNPNIQVSYQPVGSGAGVQQFTQGIVDFGASDVAMTDAEIAKVQKGVVLLPMTAGAIVVAYNVPNVQNRPEASTPSLPCHLPRSNQDLERPQNCSSQSGCEFAQLTDYDQYTALMVVVLQAFSHHT